MRPIEIVGDGQAEFRRRIQPVAPHGMQEGSYILDIQGLIACGVARRIVPAPAHIAHLPPVIEVGGHSATVYEGVDGARTADHAASRPVDAAAVQAGIRQSLVLPIDFRVGEGPPIAYGRLDPKPPIAAARLENQDPVAAPRGQAIGKHAAGRSGADDYVVKIIHAAELSPSFSRRYAISRFAHVIFRSGGPVALRGRTLYGARRKGNPKVAKLEHRRN